MTNNECCPLLGKITRGFCVCYAGPDIELMEGEFLSASFFVYYSACHRPLEIEFKTVKVRQLCTAVSLMSGAPTFDTGKKTETGEFITPPRPTGRRSNNCLRKATTVKVV